MISILQFSAEILQNHRYVMIMKRTHNSTVFDMEDRSFIETDNNISNQTALV